MYTFRLIGVTSSRYNLYMYHKYRKHIGHSFFEINKKHAFIHSLFLSKPYRKKDLGSLLLMNTEQFIYQQQIKQIHLVAYQKNDNPGLQRFYKKNGYQIKQSDSDFNIINNEYDIIELIPMFKHLTL